MDMLWCQAAQNIGLSNCKLKSALKCTVLTRDESISGIPMGPMAPMEMGNTTLVLWE